MARTSTLAPGREADELVLASKLTAPGLPGWIVARPRLDQRIAEGTGGPLTVVTGPPGAGKTMALASWAASGLAPGPVAWVTVDDYDNQPGALAASVVKALWQAGVADETTLPAPPEGMSDPAFLPRLASALASPAAASPAPASPAVVLVLDDLHLLTTPGPLDELAYLLRYARPGLRLLAASRIDPRLPLHRHRLAGELTEIRAGELAFTIPEATLLMAQHGLGLPGPAVSLITGRVEGWAAGLRLAALSLQGHPDPEVFIKNLTAEDNPLTSYLVDEVLDSQPAAARELMLRTSILDRVSAELALELTGDDQSASTLAGLARAGAFVQPLGHGWYRYHCLLADVLRLKLRRESPDLAAGLHRRAASWYHRQGLASQAVAHAAQINDWPLAARIAVDGLATGELLQPRRSPVADSLRRIRASQARPEGPAAAPPLLLAAAALELRAGGDQAAGRLLAGAESSLNQLPGDREIPSRLSAALLRLAASRRSGDLGAASDAAAEAETCFGQLAPGLDRRRPEVAAQVRGARGVVEFWSGRHDGAAVAFAAAGAAAPEGSWEQAACHGYLALIEALGGRLSRAAELARAGIHPPAGRRASPPVPAGAVALALVHLERNELDASHRLLKQAGTALKAHPDRLISAVASLVAARGALAQASAPAAAHLIRQAREHWSPPSWLGHLLSVAEAQAAAAAGDIPAALDAARRAGPESAPDAAVALARAWLAAGNLNAARQALAGAPALPDGERGDRDRLELYLTDALLRYRSHDPDGGRRSLDRALRLGEPEHYRLPFALNQAWIQPALRHGPEPAAPRGGPARDAGRGESAAGPSGASRRDPVIVEQLTDREREVLRFASSMLSTEEIAAAMYLSVNTVKTHLKSIFRKLGTTRRGAAVRRARELGLI